MKSWHNGKRPWSLKRLLKRGERVLKVAGCWNRTAQYEHTLLQRLFCLLQKCSTLWRFFLPFFPPVFMPNFYISTFILKLNSNFSHLTHTVYFYSFCHLPPLSFFQSTLNILWKLFQLYVFTVNTGSKNFWTKWILCNHLLKLLFTNEFRKPGVL